MIENYTKEDCWKKNTIWLANQHKSDCCGVGCNISLLLLREMAEKAGICFTKKEKEVFI